MQLRLGGNTLDGAGGADKLVQGVGDATVKGGPGTDEFFFHGSFDNDTISDYASGAISGSTCSKAVAARRRSPAGTSCSARGKAIGAPPADRRESGGFRVA